VTATELDCWEFVACTYCDAPAGTPCTTRTGMPCSRSHACRIFWLDLPEYD